jgi:hypothetical protein
MTMKREPKDLSHKALVGLAVGLLEMMYGDTEGDIETWNPEMRVSGAELVDWVHEEMRSLRLIPDAGPRNREREENP